MKLVFDLATWLPRIDSANREFQAELGPIQYAAFGFARRATSMPRVIRKAFIQGVFAPRPCPSLQRPWLPYWPGLEAQAIHDTNAFSWVKGLRQASADIRNELLRVIDGFDRACYDSPFNEKPWNTFYFFLQGRPVPSHLAACPRTCEVLREIPHNSLHVCFSALQPGGSLHPHTGPTNASLTAHLGLLNCANSTLHVAEKCAPYRDDQVLIFDDSFVHWVENSGTATRYTLMVTFWHPELSYLERQILDYAVRVGTA